MDQAGDVGGLLDASIEHDHVLAAEAATEVAELEDDILSRSWL